MHRVVSAVDCGRVINPGGVVAQAEGAMVYGLSAALRGNITIDRGRVAETNFHQYEPLRVFHHEGTKRSKHTKKNSKQILVVFVPFDPLREFRG